MTDNAAEFLKRLQNRHSLACRKWRLADKLGLESKGYYLGYMQAIDHAFDEARKLLGEEGGEGKH